MPNQNTKNTIGDRDFRAALGGINANISLAPGGPYQRRDYRRARAIWRSVLYPDLHQRSDIRSDSERDLEVGANIDLNCDQVRAMIKIFLTTTNWTVREFRAATRPKDIHPGTLNNTEWVLFLVKRGPREGNNFLGYQMAWEFFKRRELLGFPLVQPNTGHVSSNTRDEVEGEEGEQENDNHDHQDHADSGADAGHEMREK
ncbi:hypothetical protein B0T19DRAFT_413817 [Cercophora scortea]|uniref:DUF7726 domain-containing protein n=1 Tax=Cercophora scortea TaxID=314031 RepID=A0AAE0IUW0_9PEZI|nr:hypothetical protein B0T19DRAFT_413817 [Cercophora scortea]